MPFDLVASRQGMNGLGVEIAKNLMMAGVGSLTLHGVRPKQQSGMLMVGSADRPHKQTGVRSAYRLQTRRRAPKSTCQQTSSSATTM
eukprot:SAG31_NODE_1817_length_7205_cov_10.994652_3_plen_87_part_00